MANFTLMLQDVKPPVIPEIKPLNRPSFGPVEVSDGQVDPMLSNRVIQEPAQRAFEQLQRPRFNGELDWAKGSKPATSTRLAEGTWSNLLGKGTIDRATLIDGLSSNRAER